MTSGQDTPYKHMKILCHNSEIIKVSTIGSSAQMKFNFDNYTIHAVIGLYIPLIRTYVYRWQMACL